MYSVNFGKDVKKINSDISQKRTSNKEVKAVETKSTQASSLEALSGYGRAIVNIDSLKNSAKNIANATDIDTFKKQILSDSNLKNFGIERAIEKDYHLDLAQSLCYGKDKSGNDLFPQKELIKDILYEVHKDNLQLVYDLCFGKDENGNDIFPSKELIYDIVRMIPRKEEMMKIFHQTPIEELSSFFVAKELFSKINEQGNIIPPTDIELDNFSNEFLEKTKNISNKLCFGKDENGKDLFPHKAQIKDVLFRLCDWPYDFLETFCFSKDDEGNSLFFDSGNLHKLFLLIEKNDFDFVQQLYFGKNENGNDLIEDKKSIKEILSSITGRHDVVGSPNQSMIEQRTEFAKKMYFGKTSTGEDFWKDKNIIPDIIPYVGKCKFDYIQELCFGKNSNGKDLIKDRNDIAKVLKAMFQPALYSPSPSEEILEARFNFSKQLLQDFNGDISDNVLSLISSCNNNSIIDSYNSLKSILSIENISKMSPHDITTANKIIDLYNIQDINEIPLEKKRNIIRTIVANNVSLFSLSDELKQMFPLIPSNKDEYCSILKTLCKSIGIETNVLSDEQINKFNSNMRNLSSVLAELSDEEFNALDFEQEYTKDEFIKNTYEIIKDLSPAERQKVYDYFGFELKPITHNSERLTIIGYPVNLNNGKKLAKIDNPKTEAVIEQLRPEVIKFSENNFVSCQNKEIEAYINEILNLCPEFRTEIEREQSGLHEFDVFKHSLKVMQKIVQNPKFDNLNKSDKKIMLMASMLHDVRKAEAKADPTHSNECSFDAFYISKKFALTKEETNKLYALIKNHEWLGYTNSQDIKNEEERELRIKSAAYDLYYDNLFELSKIFTEADLKAVNSNDFLYNKVKNIFETNSSRVEAYVNELKTTQPLLPVTKIPSSTRIKEAINIVNSDGSTNLNGIYQDEKGMIIIKFNEVENETWEKIGFPKNSISKGIVTTGYSSYRGDISENRVNTGNIKFFAHGLDYSEQMRNFDEFALPDSDALLSVSYMERPESKYKLFRHNGLLLDTDTRYIHGGGETDSGSGCKKSLDLFKRNYAFSDGYRHSDRCYISDLIKQSLHLTNEQYVEFVKNNANKAICEIEPKEYQEKLVKAFSTINSNVRKGERSYNEMYITNPRTMGVFAYSNSSYINNVLDFVSKQADFLKEYALEEDIPFIVFGN